MSRARRIWLFVALQIVIVGRLEMRAQSSSAPQPAASSASRVPAPQEQPPYDHAATVAAPKWQLMQDGVLFGTYNHQGGPRGRDEFRSQNWWMVMGSRQLGRGTLTLTGMVTLEPATITTRGYSELFQVGETYKKVPLVDAQHPHDFLMQMAAIWRVPLGSGGITIAGAPVGEATLGPVAFMHRRSAAENPTAPLGHHTFDSTHIAHGVVALGLDAGRVTLEGSVFQGREPDEQRWDIMDPGPLDSWAARLWLRPGPFTVQASYGFLKRPEPQEEQNVRRSTASVSWERTSGDDFTAVTAMFGHNERAFSRSSAVLTEAAHRWAGNVVYGRVEWVELETEHLLFPGFVHTPHPGELIDPLYAFTVGGLREIGSVRGVQFGAGGDVTWYDVPARLDRTHGHQPVSFHVFFRFRPPASSMGRMWNTVMTQPMREHRAHLAPPMPN